MELLIQAMLKLIKENSIYIESGIAKHQLELRLNYILREMKKQGWKWTISEVFASISYTMGKARSYKVLNYLQNNYGNEMTDNESFEYGRQLDNLKNELDKDGIIIDDSPLHQNNNKGTVESKFPSNSNNQRSQFQDNYSNNSYSGSDMVASITIPGRSPVVFGELSNVSYSILREKVPVRGLGRVTSKGYTRGMRTITGILTFVVFDQSAVYRCIEELKEQGHKMLMDEMPLFDINLTMANEFGSRSTLTIYGVSTYTEGMVMSINDMMTQNVYEFYALDIDPMTKQI
ncbi:hypothetical protein [Virgibacillus salexigens]|uniref:Uncharacterized protein n=1 Tax=Virgibacillus massiliensis TaxID=1462526 RepID=A0A024QHT1_9BACI|nr:hypothetical protein [Virgibacillus massiliensis]CDQ41812.1 hypothetical protein BN990_04189 [Virgibacillus massiliensis]